MFYAGELTDGNINGRPMDEPLTRLANASHRTIFFDMVDKSAKE
jgi:hypothetical protein